MNVWRIWGVLLALAVLTACARPLPGATPSQADVVESGTPALQPTASPSAPAVTPSQEVLEGGAAMVFQLTSTAFAQGDAIPELYSCDGADSSVPLAWTAPPTGTQSFALIADDPDAPVGTWVHWVLYNIPAAARELPEGLSADAELPDGSLHGKNSWRRLGYGGPCPPGGTHRYFFRLYALDTALALPAGATEVQLLAAMEGHILAQAELMGVYSR